MTTLDHHNPTVLDGEFVETPTGPAVPPSMPAPENNQTKENDMTSPDNPHRISTLITGWAVIATVIGGLYGASTQPEHAEWSAFAMIAAIVAYLVNKVRKSVYDRRAARVAVVR